MKINHINIVATYLISSLIYHVNSSPIPVSTSEGYMNHELEILSTRTTTTINSSQSTVLDFAPDTGGTTTLVKRTNSDDNSSQAQSHKKLYRFRGSLIYKTDAGYFYMNGTKVDETIVVAGSTSSSSSSSPATTQLAQSASISSTTSSSISLGLSSYTSDTDQNSTNTNSASTSISEEESTVAEQQLQTQQMLMQMIQNAELHSKSRQYYNVKNAAHFTDVSQLKFRV